MFSHFLAISTNAFREVIRQPIYGVILAGAAAILILSPAVALFSMMEDVKLVQDMGLGTILLAGLFLAVVSSSATLRREVEHQTAATVLSKPVGRGAFLSAKYAGILASIGMACLIWILLLLFAVRMKGTDEMGKAFDYPILLAELLPIGLALFLGLFLNYFQNRPFVSTAVLSSLPLYLLAFLLTAFVDKRWQFTSFGEYVEVDVLMAAGLVFLAVTILAAAAFAVSTRLPTVPTVIVCLGLLFAGLISDYVFGRFASENLLAKIAYTVTPNLQAFWMADVLARDKSIPAVYLGWALGYAACYQMGILSLAAMLFERREVT